MKNIMFVILATFIFSGCSASKNINSIYKKNKIKGKNLLIDKSVDFSGNKLKNKIKN